jgi:hypothetical protein
MKALKAFTLTVAAAIVAAALIGPASSSADTICKVEENPCKNENRYQNGTNIRIVGSAHQEDKFGFAEMECEFESAGTITNNNVGSESEEQSQVEGVTTKMAWSNCTPEGCTETSLQTPWQVHAERGGQPFPDGIVWVGPNEEGKSNAPAVSLNAGCGNFGNCTWKVKGQQPGYGAEQWGSSIVKGGTEIGEGTIQLRSPNCFVQIDSEAKAELLEPKPMYVSQTA